MALKLYNTLGRKKQTFKPVKENEVGIYECGPTVYWYQHIGNLRRYIFGDILTRVLRYDGFNVKRVINVTDVGHLTSDSDEGEDKMEKAVKKEKKTAKEIADYYWNVFKRDLDKLNVMPPEIWCKATEHIQEQIDLIKKLEKKGFTYETSDGIYFDTSKFKNYGKLALLKTEGLEAGKRIEMREKKNPTDFALWKFSEAPGKRQQEWDPKKFGANWKLGFPGWHIECSAMSMKYLGNTFDIHTGGIDHIPIHHTNEIAQAEAATGKKCVKYWMHSNFLTSKGEKVSKSTGGLFTLSELEEQGFVPMDFRYFVLTGHYSKPLDFSIENLENAKKSYERLKSNALELKDDGKVNKEYLKEFEDAINNDLNTPQAISVLWDMLRDAKAEGKYKTIHEMEKVFALDLFKKKAALEIPSEIQKMVDEREAARKSKNWKTSDEIRNKLKELGWHVDDTAEGPKLKKL